MNRMQGRVSMVIPCYNKEDYIGAMLDSVIAQEWDNIELILVNDGSTDGTRGIIAGYEPRLRARGYDVVIIDQANAGCCSAVKAGLERVSGEYLCLVDADDALDPLYVSTMAGWLGEHGEYDYCSCDYLVVDGEGQKKPFVPHLWPQERYTPEFFFCNDPSKAAWAFMTRMEYIRRCRLVELFHTDTRGSYEPSFFIPFVAQKGRMKHFDLPLYHYSSDAGGLSQARAFERMETYWREYHRVVLLMLDKIPHTVLDAYEKRHMKALSSFYTLKLLLLMARWRGADAGVIEGLEIEFAAYVNNWLSINPRITREDARDHTLYVCRAAELAVSGMWDAASANRGAARVIGYGALGQSAARLLPLLQGTPWQPDELWDAEGDGVRVKKPDLNALGANDAVLVFPTNPSVLGQVRNALAASGARVLYRDDIRDLVARLRYPQFGNV